MFVHPLIKHLKCFEEDDFDSGWRSVPLPRHALLKDVISWVQLEANNQPSFFNMLVNAIPVISSARAGIDVPFPVQFVDNTDTQ